jgi:Yip1 domain
MDPIIFIVVATFVAVVAAILFVVFGADSIAKLREPLKLSQDRRTVSEPDPRVQGLQPPYEEEHSPLWSEHLVDLFFRPGKFFTEQPALGKAPFFLFVTWCYGIANAIGQVNRDLARETTGRAKPSWRALGLMVDESWLAFWFWVLCTGVIAGFFLWLFGGWWFKVRLRWSGAKELKDQTAHLLYVYSSFVESAPTIAMVLLWTVTQPSYRQAFAAKGIYSAVLFLFSFCSLATSYIGARTLFTLEPWKARVWLLALPIIFYTLALGLLFALTFVFRTHA